MPSFHGEWSGNVFLIFYAMLSLNRVVIFLKNILYRVPMYSEAKLAFIIYLWYPRTKV